MDLFLELEQKQAELDKAIKELRKAGQNWSEADKTYRVLKAKAKFRLKAEGVAVGMLEDGVFVDEDVADALQQRDLTDVLVTACKEEINSIKIQIAIIREQLAREYGR